MTAILRRIAPRKYPKPLIVFASAVDPWAGHPLWGAFGPYDAPLWP